MIQFLLVWYSGVNEGVSETERQISQYYLQCMIQFEVIPEQSN